MNLENLKEHRNEILWWEIGSILHDVGKLSKEFLNYRQTWHTKYDGYRDKDPHDHEWFTGQPDKDGLLKDFPDLKRFFEKVHESAVKGELSVANAVHNHIAPLPDDELASLLKLADGVDSQYDRNNPLIGSEQTDHQNPDHHIDLYRSNVFGYESDATRVVPDVLEKARKELYGKLQTLIAPYLDTGKELSEDDYYKTRKILRRYFRPALSDTTRPNNDTDLWEHTYSVASIAKALHIQTLLGESVDRKKCFRIWGVGFDGLRYLSMSHKIGDLLGRREVIDDIFKSVQRLMEFDLPFGNAIYRDDNFLFFMVPALCDPGLAEAERILRPAVIERSLYYSDQELVPCFVAGPRVATLTNIVAQIGKLRKKIAFPVSEGAGQLADGLRGHWLAHSAGQKSVCSVCQLRPTHREQANALVCQKCLGRRRNRTESFAFVTSKQIPQTPMISEIADKNGRAVMIVAKLGLSRWLDGSMVRTSFVTQANAIERTAIACRHITEQPLGQDGLLGAQAISQRPRNDYDQMLADLRECRYGNRADLLFLYGRGIVADPDLRDTPNPPPRLNRDIKGARKTWQDRLEDFRREQQQPVSLSDDEILLNLICAKTPTPSTILDAWQTTREFFRGIAGEREVFSQDPAQEVFRKIPSLLSGKSLGLGARSRAWFRLNQLPAQPKINKHETLTAHIGGNAYEVVYEGAENRFWFVDRDKLPEKFPADVVLEPEDQEKLPPCHAEQSDVKEQAYLPYRCISASPDLLLLLAPAEKAVEITEKIYASYREEFGKAYGRLPLSIGHIFFAKHQPMFSVLDAARRMEANFRELHRYPETMDLPVKAHDLTLKLGNGEDDWHHPYIVVPEASPETPGYFKTIEGPVLPIADVKTDQKIKGHKNYYDAEFLGASAHRFRLHLAPRMKGGPDEGPIPLEDLIGTSKRRGMRSVWQAICNSGATDSSVRNFEEAIARRRASWRSGGSDEAEKAALALAANLVSSYFPREHEAIQSALEDRLFFRTLNLYLRILKRRVRDCGPDNTSQPNQKAGEPRANTIAPAVPAAPLSR